MRLLVLVLLAALAQGCSGSSLAPYRITSAPPGGRIQLDGKDAGTAPATVNLPVSYRWVGVMYSSDGWAVDSDPVAITVHPPASAPRGLAAQTKRITPTRHGGTLHFDLRAHGSP